MAALARRGGRGRRDRLQHLPHPQPPQLQRRAHPHPHRRRRRAARHRPRRRRHRHRRAAGRVRLRRRRRRVRALPLDGRGLGPAAVVLAAPASTRGSTRGSSTCSTRPTPTACGCAARPPPGPSGSSWACSARVNPLAGNPRVAGDRRRCRSPSRRARWPSPASRSGSWPPRDEAAAAGADRMFELGDPPDYEPDPVDEHRGPRRPARVGSPLDLRLRPLRRRTRAARSSTCRSSTGSTAPSTRVGEMLAHQHTVPGLSDGGAHVGTICDASFPTTLLSHWGRDRDRRPPRPRRTSCGSTPRTPRRPSACSTGACSPRATAPTSTSSTSTPCAPAAPRCATTSRPAASGSCSGPTATTPPSSRARSPTERGEPTDALPGRLLRGATAGARPDDRARRPRGALRVAQRTRSATPTSGSSPTPTAAELEAALEHAEAHTEHTLDITAELFPLPTLGPAAGRGRPRADRGPRRGAHPRRARRPARPRPRLGRLLGHRRATSAARGRRTTRATCSATSPTRARPAPTPPAAATRSAGVAFPFHSDGSDLVGLFCLNAGAGGGASLVANAVTIHNELVRTEPELAAALYDEFAYDFRGEEKPGSRPWYLMPLFTERDGRLFVRYIRPVHPRAPGATPTRPPPSAVGRGGHGPRRRHVRRPGVPPLDAARAGRHAVREQLPRAPRTRRLHGRPRRRRGPAPQAALARDRRAHRRRQARGVPAHRHHRDLVEGRLSAARR